jgi:transcriptional regulator with XRE-family HTH domain
MKPLHEVIRERMDERGWSYGDVARRGGLPRSTVHHLATVDGLSRPPHPVTLERLARGLELPLEVLRAAAATTAGFATWTEPVSDPEIDVLVAALHRLSSDDLRHVRALVQSMLEAGGRDS